MQAFQIVARMEPVMKKAKQEAAPSLLDTLEDLMNTELKRYDEELKFRHFMVTCQSIPVSREGESTQYRLEQLFVKPLSEPGKPVRSL